MSQEEQLFLYACVARNNKVEVMVNKLSNSKISLVVEKLVETIDFYVNHKKSYMGHEVTSGNKIHYVVEDETAYCVVATPEASLRLCYAFLKELHQRLSLSFAGLDKSQQRIIINQLMDYCSTHPEKYDPIIDVKQRIDEVKGNVRHSIELVADRGTLLHDLEGKSNSLLVKSETFQKQSNGLKWKMRFDSMKTTIALLSISTAATTILTTTLIILL